MRIAIALVLATVLVSSAAAEDTKQHAKADNSEYEPGTSVEMPFLIAPMNRDGKLVAYAYISSKIIAPSRNAAVGVREKTPFLQDAFIRDVNAAPIAKTDDPLTVDRPALVARLLADAKRIAGSNRVVSFVVTQIQIAQAHPSRG